MKTVKIVLFCILFCTAIAAGAKEFLSIPDVLGYWLPVGPDYDWTAEDPPPDVAAAMGDSDPVVISNGFVILDGELLERPYVVWRNGNGVKINGRLYGRREPVRPFATRENPPDVPAGVPSDSEGYEDSYDHWWWEYWNACEEYVFTRVDRMYALPSEFAPLMERLPCFRRVWVWEPEPGCAPEETYLRVEWNGGTNRVETVNVVGSTSRHFYDQRSGVRVCDMMLRQVTNALLRGDVVLQEPSSKPEWFPFPETELQDIEDMAPSLAMLGRMANGTAPTNGEERLRAERPDADLLLSHLESYRWIGPGVLPHWPHSRTDVHRRVLTDGHVVTNGVRAALPLELTADRDGVHLGDLTIDRRFEGSDVDEDELPDRYRQVLSKMCGFAWSGIVVVSGDRDSARTSCLDSLALLGLDEAWNSWGERDRDDPERFLSYARSRIKEFVTDSWLAAPEHLSVLTKEEVGRLRRQKEEEIHPSTPGAFGQNLWFPRTPRNPYHILFP